MYPYGGAQSAVKQPATSEVRELILKDKTGEIRAKLHLREDMGEQHPTLEMYDKDGNLNAAIGAFGKGAVLMIRGHGKAARTIQIGVGANESHMTYTDSENVERIALVDDKDKAETFLVFKEGEQRRIAIGSVKKKGIIEVYTEPNKVLRYPPE